MSDDTKTYITTAEALGKFYHELIDAGIPPELVGELVINAGKTILNEGLGVRGDK